MPRILGPIPDHVLRLMSDADREPLGKAGVTTAEASAKADAMAEKELQRQMIELLGQRDIVVNASRMDRRKTDLVGWPDLTFAVNGKACAVEVKRPGEVPTADQIQMIIRMQRNGWTVRVLQSLESLKLFLDEMTL